MESGSQEHIDLLLDPGQASCHAEFLAYQNGYRANKDGTVTGPSGRRVNGSPSKRLGYWRFTLHVDGGSRSVVLHRLVALQKFGSALYAPGTQVRHLDGNKNNNTWENIAIGTARDNNQDKPVDVRERVCEAGAAKLRKLTFEQVKTLREDRAAGATYKQLMEKYAIAKSTVAYIVNRHTYRKDFGSSTTTGAQA